MQATFLAGPQLLEVRTIPEPALPEDGVIVQVKVCGVCGSDLRRWKEGPRPGDLPSIPGHEFSGVVTAIGPRCSGYQVGDRLSVGPDIHCGRCYYCARGMYNLCDHLRFLGVTPGIPGGFAEYVALDGDTLLNGIVHPMPDNLSFEHAALAEPCSSVLATHEKLDTHWGDTVAVLGAGPIGCLHTIVARRRGARVILSEPSRIRRELVQWKLTGALQPLMILDPLQEDVVAQVRALTDDRGADIVICANPVAATVTQAVEMVRKAGKVALFGGLPRVDPRVTVDGNRIHYGEILLVGAFSYHPVHHALALEFLANGGISGEAVITHRFPLAQVAEAFDVAAGGQALKVVVKC